MGRWFPSVFVKMSKSLSYDVRFHALFVKCETWHRSKFLRLSRSEATWTRLPSKSLSSRDWGMEQRWQTLNQSQDILSCQSMRRFGFAFVDLSCRPSLYTVYGKTLISAALNTQNSYSSKCLANANPLESWSLLTSSDTRNWNKGLFFTVTFGISAGTV